MTRFKLIKSSFGLSRRFLFINKEDNTYLYAYRDRKGVWYISTKLGVEISKEDINEIKQTLEIQEVDNEESPRSKE